MIATTIISSIRVKPPCPVLTYFRIPCLFMRWYPLLVAAGRPLRIVRGPCGVALGGACHRFGCLAGSLWCQRLPAFFLVIPAAALAAFPTLMPSLALSLPSLLPSLRYPFPSLHYPLPFAIPSCPPSLGEAAGGTFPVARCRLPALGATPTTLTAYINLRWATPQGQSNNSSSFSYPNGRQGLRKRGEESRRTLCGKVSRG
jgi:hypothetical protein